MFLPVNRLVRMLGVRCSIMGILDVVRAMAAIKGRIYLYHAGPVA